MAETIIMKGALEDHLGRVIHPDTEADQVLRPNGETAEAAFLRLLAMFSNYLPMTGGTVGGPLGTDKTFTVNMWGGISAGTDGSVVFAENCYKHPTNNTFHFARTHESMGARGIVLQNGQPGIWYFDTGSRATTADEQFTTPLISMTDKSTRNVSSRNMNDIRENGFYDGTDMTNAPGTGWFWFDVINHSLNPDQWCTQIAYQFGENTIYQRNQANGNWGPWEKILNTGNSPTLHYATWEPLATDGKEGDVWDVYV